MVGPVVTSLTLTIGGYSLAYFFIGIGFLIIAPIIYTRLSNV